MNGINSFRDMGIRLALDARRRDCLLHQGDQQVRSCTMCTRIVRPALRKKMQLAKVQKRFYLSFSPRKLLIRNIPYNVCDNRLQSIVGGFGDLEECRVLRYLQAY